MKLKGESKMGNIIITYNQIRDINHILEEKGLYFKLHLHDACGSQSFTIEAEGNPSDENYNKMKNEV